MRWLTSLAVVCAVTAGAAGCASLNKSTTSYKPGILVPAFANTQTPTDELSVGKAEGDGLTADSTRLLGSNDLGKYWTALDAEGNICLVVAPPKEREDGSEGIQYFGSTCIAPKTFSESGLSLSVNSDGVGNVSVLLLPGDVDPTSVNDAIKIASSETSGTIDHFETPAQLITMSLDAASSLKAMEVDRTNGDSMTLRPAH